MAMELRMLHKITSDGMMEKGFTKQCIGFIFISDKLITELPLTPIHCCYSECGVVSGIQSGLAVNGY